jgi:cytochrome P450
MSSIQNVASVEPVSAPVEIVELPSENRLWGNIRVIAWNNLEFFQLCEKMGGIVKTRGFLKRVYVVNDPGAIADVLVKHPNSFEKPFVLRRLRVLFGNGLLTSDGEVWKYNRHLVQPAFSAGHLPEFVSIVQKNTAEMMATWRGGEERDLYHDMVELCMKNVTQALFGVYDDELADIVRGLADTCHKLVKFVLGPGGLLPFLWPGPLKTSLQKNIKALSAYLDRLIDERRKEPPKADFLRMLMTPRQGIEHPRLGRQAIRDECITILLAGHETSASALVWTLYLLAKHPACADALATELTSQLHGEAPSLGDLERLPLLRGTLDESLRLYPPTHRIGRTVKTPVMVGGNLLPKGAEVLLPQWSVHRSSRWYELPGQFVPARWTPEFRHSLPRFAYFPFSGGPHACVGGNLAWSEAAVILGMLGQRFRFTPCDKGELKPKGGLTLLPGGGEFRVTVERR